jgi:hypothetical protein
MSRKTLRFRDGETMGELRLHYATLGKPVRDAAAARYECGDVAGWDGRRSSRGIVFGGVVGGEVRRKMAP